LIGLEVVVVIVVVVAIMDHCWGMKRWLPRHYRHVMACHNDDDDDDVSETGGFGRVAEAEEITPPDAHSG